MVRFSLRDWFAREWFACDWLTRQATVSKARTRKRLQQSVERLETRWVLSSFTVDSTNDSVDATPGDGVAADVSGLTTLRAAVIEANAVAGADSITLGAGVFTLSIAGRGENAAATGDLDVVGDLTIEGAGVGETILDANLLDRYFQVAQGASLTLRNVTIRNGRETTGGAITNNGTLILQNVVLTENASTLRGGAINNSFGTIQLSDVDFTANVSRDVGPTGSGGNSVGGAISSDLGVITITGGSFANNTAAAEGGAIDARSATLQITGTTFSNNTATVGGAIRLFSGSATLTSITSTGDHAVVYGGAIASNYTALTVNGGTFTGNSLAPIPVTGAVRNGGVMYLSGSQLVTITGVTFQQTGDGDGGGIYLSQTELRLSNSTFDRVSGQRGGAIWVGVGGVLRMWNTTIVGGSGTLGGAILNDSTIDFYNNTITGTTSASGAAVVNRGPSAQMVSNIVAGNVGLDIAGNFSSNGGNVIGQRGTATGFDSPTDPDQVGTAQAPIDPLLSPLADNGGPVKTMALSAQSPARDGGDFGGPFTDARGLSRSGSRPDAGAYEYQNRAPVAGFFTANAFEDVVLTGQLAATDADGDALTFELVQPPFLGTMTVAADGQFSYTAAENFFGEVWFAYRVTDGRSSPIIVNGRIVVQPVNDPPTVADQSFNIPENLSNGNLIGFIQASDIDSSGGTFELVSSSVPGAIAVHPFARALYVTDSTLLNYETNPTITVVVRMTDNGTPAASTLATMTIHLTDVNDAPQFQGAQYDVLENSRNGTVIGYIQATDDDAGQSLTYEFASDFGVPFAIDRDTGAITVTNEAEVGVEYPRSWSAVVRVTDNGNPELSQQAWVVFHLVNVNDPPVVADQTFEVAENSFDGQFIGGVRAADAEGGVLHGELVSGLEDGALVFDTQTGAIYVGDGRLLNFETTPTIQFVVRIHDDGSPSASSLATITVNLTDVNELGATPPVTFTLDENSPNGTVVGTVPYLDEDATSTLIYEIVGEPSAFAINEDTGEITVADSSRLNFELQTAHHISVRIMDVGQPTYSAFSEVTIELRDVNDPPVVFDATFTIDENLGYDIFVGGVAAFDVDSSSVTIEIVSGNESGAFVLNAFNGALFVADSSPLDFETNPVFHLVVKVTDNGSPAAFTLANVTVNLRDVNEPPLVAAATFAVDENAANGTSVGTATVADQDVGQSHTFTILESSIAGAFSIDANTGAITVADGSLLNYEARTTHTLQILAVDNGEPARAGVALITIELNNLNEAPRIASSGFALHENSADGTVVGTVAGTDPDAGQSLTYSILSGNTDGAFAIHATTGQITVANAAALDFETSGPFSLQVQATDNGTPNLSATAAVTISLLDINETPQLAVHSFSLAENSANGTVVGTVTGTDPDAGQSLTYSIFSGNGSGAFAIDAITGEITVANAAALDFETAPVFNLEVVATDDGSPNLGALASVTVSLTDVNEAPQLAPRSFSLAENSANGTVVGTISGTDPDVGQSLSYSILSGNVNGAFAIDASTGQITVASSSALNFETTPSFGLQVQATDGSLSAVATVSVSLTNVNEAPQLAATSFSLNENSANGTVVGTITGTDPDAEQTLSYSILSGNTNGAFAIDATTGQIRVASQAALDFEATPTFSLVVRASDNGSPQLSATATVTVNLNDVSEGPRILPQSFSVAENSSKGTTVGTVVASNPISGQGLTYAIVSGNTSTAFSINTSTGQIKVANKAALNFEVTPTFALVVRATQAGAPGLSSTATITVSLTNVNEGPQIAAQTLSIAENSANGTVVGNVAASDPDAGQPLAYSITSGNTNGAFAINAATGQLTVANAAALNYESRTSFSLVVRVADNGSPSLSASATVTVSVTNVNEAPQLLPQSFSLPESSPNGTTVGTVVASDPDAGQTFTWSIVSGNTNTAFAINASTGKITVANVGALNFEATPTFTLQVRVQDGGNPALSVTAAVTINLTDVAEALSVSLDVIPGDSSNTIRLNRNIEVAVLSTASFDARNINVTTLRFGAAGTENSLVRNSSGQPSYSYRDVDGDGRLDLVVLIDAGDTGLVAGDTLARLTGSLNDGQTFTGVSSVTVRR